MDPEMQMDVPAPEGVQVVDQPSVPAEPVAPPSIDNSAPPLVGGFVAGDSKPIAPSITFDAAPVETQVALSPTFVPEPGTSIAPELDGDAWRTQAAPAQQPTPAAPAAPTSSTYGQSTESAQIAMRVLMGKGLSKEDAAAFVWNFQQESGKNLRTDLTHDEGTGYGIAGFRDPQPGKGRRTNLFKFAGTNRPSLEQQVEFAWHELNTTEKATLDRVRAATSPEAKAAAAIGYFRPRADYAAQRASRSREVYALLGDSQFNNQIPLTDVQAPAPTMPNESTLRQQRVETAAREEARPWYSGVVTDAFQQSNLTVRAASLVGESFAPDPTFQLTPEVQSDLMKQYSLSEPYREVLGSAVSMKHAINLAEQAQADQQRVERIASYGWAGTGATLFASLVDPAAIVAGVATGGLADAAAVGMGLARAGRAAAQAIGGAAANVGLEAGIGATGVTPHGGNELLWAAASGALFGATYGLVARNPATIEEAIMLRKQGSTLKRSLEDSTSLTDPGAGSVGAASNPNVNLPHIRDAAVESLHDAQVPTTYGKLFGIIPIRFSAAGQVKQSPNALSRLVGGIGLDSVGWKNKAVNDFSAAEEAELLLRQHQTRLHQVWAPAAQEWARDQGHGIAGKFARVLGGSDFNEQVYRYVVNTNKNIEWHDAVKRVGDTIRQLNADILRMAKNPGERYGLTSRAVQGFQDVKENGNYMTRIYAGEKVNAARAAYGDKGLMEWTKGAIRKAQPDLSDAEIESLARWHVKRIVMHANGVDERMNLALSGFDQDHLKEVMIEAGVPEERVEKLFKTAAQDDKAGADTRAKRRLFLDETYVLRGYPKTSGGAGDISLNDLVVTDAALLSHIYYKHMTGRIALANFKVRNPDTGEMIIDGITSDNEWAAVKKKIGQYAIDNLPGPKAQASVESDLTNLDYMYDHILGRSDKDATGNAAAWLRRFGDANYIRLGANFGFAQLPETVAPVAHLGIRAMMNVMPAFRRFVRGGAEVLRDDGARTVEAMWGLGADASKGFQYIRYEDTGASFSGVGGKADNVLGFTKQAVSHASGLHIVNAALQRWTGKAIIQRFADLARKATEGTSGAINLDKIKPAQLERMRYLGLSDDMLKRVLKEMRENITLEDGLLFKHKVTRINMDAWSDQEARAAFENAGFRWARQIIQENDIGTMHRWMAKPIAKMLMQFRVFPLVAWDKQFLHNLHMRDMTSFNIMWMSMAAGSATYALQTHMQAATRADKEKFLEERLSTKNLAAAGFQRSGWSSLLPTAWDTGAYVMGGNPMFDFRTSGQPSDAIFGNPTMSMIDDLSKATKGLVKPILDGRERSQQEYRNIQRVLPFATWLPSTMLLSSMISDKPQYAPKDVNK